MDQPRYFPAAVRKALEDFADAHVPLARDRDNLEIVIAMHWFFLHSREHKQRAGPLKHCGKWKIAPASADALLATVRTLLPVVAAGVLPVMKFTNLGNVFSGEHLAVVYCFPSGPSPAAARDLLRQEGLDARWGSDFFAEPAGA